MSNPLTIGARLQALIPPGHQRKSVAAAWLDAWNSSKPSKPFSQGGVASQLSRVLGSEPEGVRFFFGDDNRVAATWKAFPNATASDQTEIAQMARDILDGRDHRVILDLTSGPTKAEHVPVLLASARTKLLAEDAAYPAIVLVNAQQYDSVPRSFDDIRPRLRVHCVADEEERKAFIDAAPHALIVSEKPTDAPYERWAALKIEWARDPDSGRNFGESSPARPTVGTHPHEALATFARDCVLDRLPPVTRPLRQLGEPAATPLQVSDAAGLRDLMSQLASGALMKRSSYESKSVAIEDRLAWARALNVEASATQEEWLEMLPRRLEPATIVPIEWERHVRAMARFGSTDAFAFIGEESVRVLNAPLEVRERFAGDSTTQFDDVAADRVVLLREFFEQAAAMTTDDAEEDPFLLGLVARNARDEDDEYVLGLARIVLLASAVLDPDAPDLIETWTDVRKGIITLLRERLPESRLQIDSGEHRVELDRHEWESFSTAVLAAGNPEWLVGIARSTLAPPCAPVTVDRAYGRGKTTELRADAESAGSPVDWCVAFTALGGEPEAWGDEFVRGAMLRSVYGSKECVLARRSRAYALNPDQYDWHAADRLAVTTLAAVRNAAEIRTPLELPSGEFLLPIGAGVLAEIEMRLHPACAGAVQVSLEQPPPAHAPDPYHRQPEPAPSLTRRVTVLEGTTNGYTTATTVMGPPLPHSIHVSGHGLKMRIRFIGSALFDAPVPRDSILAAMSAGERDGARSKRHDEDRSEEEARQRDDDD